VLDRSFVIAGFTWFAGFAELYRQFYRVRPGPASHVRMVLGRDRVRGRSPSAIFPLP